MRDFTSRITFLTSHLSFLISHFSFLISRFSFRGIMTGVNYDQGQL